MIRHQINYKHYRVEFGTYVQVHENHDNYQQSKTSGVTALHTSVNEQGGNYFLSLDIDKRMLRNLLIMILMAKDIIGMVHQLAALSK